SEVMFRAAASLHRFRLLIAIVCAGSALSVAGAVFVRHREFSRFEAAFNLGADRRIRAIRREVEGDLAALNALRGFMEVPQPFAAADFERFAGRLLESHPTLLAVEWVSHVRGAAERKAFELEMRKMGV